jgi:hypothetical protein
MVGMHAAVSRPRGALSPRASRLEWADAAVIATICHGRPVTQCQRPRRHQVDLGQFVPGAPLGGDRLAVIEGRLS